jgi:hypothetical protein
LIHIAMGGDSCGDTIVRATIETNEGLYDFDETILPVHSEGATHGVPLG